MVVCLQPASTAGLHGKGDSPALWLCSGDVNAGTSGPSEDEESRWLFLFVGCLLKMWECDFY